MSQEFTPWDPQTETRLFLTISDEDGAKIGRGRGWINRRVIVTDLNTNRKYKVRGAACSAPRCACDAVVIESWGGEPKD